MPDDDQTPETQNTGNDENISLNEEASNVYVQPEVEPTTPLGDTQPNLPTQSQPIEQQPSVFQPVAIATSPKKSKKKMIIAGIASFVAVLLIGGGVFAYFVINNSPQKILGDALTQLSDIKSLSGSSDSGSTGQKVKTTFEAIGKDNQYSGKIALDLSASMGSKFVINIDAVFDKQGNAYVKFDGVSKVISQYAGLFYTESYATLAKKYEGSWIKISSTDLKSTDKEASMAQQCFTELNTKLSDKSFRKDVTKTYRENQFIIVKEELGDKEGNVGYVIDVDEAISNKFANDFKQTDAYASIKESCATVFKDDNKTPSTSKKDDDSTVKVWISRDGHKLQKLEVVGDKESTGNFETKFDYSGNKSVTIPDSSYTVDELMKDFEKAQQDGQSFMENSYGNDSTGSMTPTETFQSPAVRNPFF